MAITLVTTPGASDANAFVSLVDANAFHKGRVHNSEWNSASSGDKSAAIVMATRSLCYNYSYGGTRTEETGSLDWPRTDVTDEDDYDLASDTIPQFMKDATSEFAFLLLREDSTVAANISGSLKELEAGDVSLVWNQMDSDELPEIPKSVQRIISFYVASSSSSMVVRLIRA